NRGKPDVRLGRVSQLRHHSRGPDLSPLASQYGNRDDRIAGARHRARDGRRAGIPGHLPRQTPRPARAAVAMGRARLARRDRVDLDLRLDVQRDQLDAQGDRAAPRLAVLARRAWARALRDHHRAGVAYFPVRHGDRARGTLVDSAGRCRGIHRGRRGLLATALPGRAAAPASGHRRRCVVRGRLHRHRSRRRLHPDGRGPGEYHAGPAHTRLPAWRAGCRPRPGCRHRRIPRAVSDRGRRPHAAGRPPDRRRRRGGGGGGGPMKRLGLYGRALGVLAVAGCPFYWVIPPTLLFIPFSRVISALGLQNSLGALILIYPTMTIPFCTWLVMGFMRAVPWDIEEQAMIDGYSRLAVILRVAPRLILPGILT